MMRVVDITITRLIRLLLLLVDNQFFALESSKRPLLLIASLFCPVGPRVCARSFDKVESSVIRRCPAVAARARRASVTFGSETIIREHKRGALRRDRVEAREDGA